MGKTVNREIAALLFNVKVEIGPANPKSESADE
jgi:hypothetical protein